MFVSRLYNVILLFKIILCHTTSWAIQPGQKSSSHRNYTKIPGLCSPPQPVGSHPKANQLAFIFLQRISQMPEKQNPPEVQNQQFKGSDLIVLEHGETLAMPKYWR